MMRCWITPLTCLLENGAEYFQTLPFLIFPGRMVSHFYGNGDVCDLTDKPRQVTVKLK